MNSISLVTRYLLLALCFYMCLNFSSASEERMVAKAEVQSCSGCSLNGLPEVKAFIFKDVPKYDDLVFKHISGAPPELVLFSDKYEEIERIPLRGLSRDECNKLLQDKGFKMKEESSEKKEL